MHVDDEVKYSENLAERLNFEEAAMLKCIDYDQSLVHTLVYVVMARVLSVCIPEGIVIETHAERSFDKVCFGNILTQLNQLD